MHEQEDELLPINLWRKQTDSSHKHPPIPYDADKCSYSERFFFKIIRSPRLNRSSSQLIKAAQKGDIQKRNHLIEAYLPFVYVIARYYCTENTMLLDDLFEDGVIGLTDAIMNYNPASEMSFTTYAAFKISSAIKSSSVQYDLLAFKQIDVLSELDIENKDCEYYPDYKLAFIESLQVEINEALNHISERTRYMIQNFYGLGCKNKTLQEIGEPINLTGETVRQRIVNTIKTINKENGFRNLKQFIGGYRYGYESDFMPDNKFKIQQTTSLYSCEIILKNIYSRKYRINQLLCKEGDRTYIPVENIDAIVEVLNEIIADSKQLRKGARYKIEFLNDFFLVQFVDFLEHNRGYAIRDKWKHKQYEKIHPFVQNILGIAHSFISDAVINIYKTPTTIHKSAI